MGIEETVQEDLKLVAPENIFRTRYEEFILKTREIMTDICKQFDLRHDEKAVGRYPVHLENRNAKWPRECTTEQIETMRKWLTPMLIEYGYESSPDWPTPEIDETPAAEPVSV